MSHVDEGQLHAWLDGEFASTGADEAAFEAHLESCALCLGRLDRARADREEADRILALMNPVVAEVPPFEAVMARGRDAEGRDAEETGRVDGVAGVPGRRPSRGAAGVAVGWAATVVLALGLGWMARGAATGPERSAPGSEGSDVVAVAEVDEPTAGAAADVAAFEADGPREEARVAPPAAAPPPPPPALEPPAVEPPVVEPPAVEPPAVAPLPAPGAAAERARSLAPELARGRADDVGAGPGVTVQLTRGGLRIQNNRAARIVYLVMDSDVAARTRWVPCVSPECQGVDPGEATEVPQASVPGWNGSPAVLVFWWHLAPQDEGGLAPDSIRSIPVAYPDD